MTLEQLEQRLTALEEFIEELRRERNGDQDRHDAPPAVETPAVADELIPGAEYDLVPDVPPKQVFHFTAKLVSIDPGPRGLALSDEAQSLASKDDLIPGAEYDLVPDVPLIQEMIVLGKIGSVEEDEHGLGLSQAE
jgi:hypothetical protein